MLKKSVHERSETLLDSSPFHRASYEKIELNNYKAPEQTKVEECRKLTLEFLSTEKTYIRQIKSLYHFLVLPLFARVKLGAPMLSSKEIWTIFMNISDILKVNEDFYKELKKLRDAGTLNTNEFPRLICNMLPSCRIYSVFISGYQEAARKLKEWKQERKEFALFMSCCELTMQLAGIDLTLTSLMITPVQRLPRYVLFLRALVEATAKDDPTRSPMIGALHTAQDVALDVNASLDVSEQHSRVFQIQMMLDPFVELVTTNRSHIRDGHLKKKLNRKSLLHDWTDVWFFLFSDIFMYTTLPNAKKSVRVKQICPLTDLVVNSKDKDKLVIEWSKKQIILRCKSTQEREEWFEAIKSTAKR